MIHGHGKTKNSIRNIESAKGKKTLQKLTPMMHPTFLFWKKSDTAFAPYLEPSQT